MAARRAAAAPAGPSLQDVLAALQSDDDESWDDDAAIATARGGFDDDDAFLQGLFDDDVVDHDEDPTGTGAMMAPIATSSDTAVPVASSGPLGVVATMADAPSSGLDPDTGVVAAAASSSFAAPPPLWDDSLALSFPSASGVDQPLQQPELVASASGSATHDDSQLDILGADEIEQLASGMLEMGSPTAATSAAADIHVAGGVVDIGVVDIDDGTGISMMSRMRMASSWHLGPGANAKSKGRQEDAGSDANSNSNSSSSSSRSRRVLPVRKARSNSGVEYDDTAPANSGKLGGGGTKRRSSGESVASAASSVTSADGKPGKQIVGSGDASACASGDGNGNVAKKRKKSSAGSSGGGGGSGNKKNTAKNTKKKKADAIAKKAAEILGLDLSTVPQRPKQAPNTFLLFCNSNRSRIKAENPNVKGSQMNSFLGEHWKALSDRAKQPYVDAAAEAAKEYAIKLEAYNAAIQRFRKTDDGKRWVDEQDRLLRQSVEEEGRAWEASMGIATKEKEEEDKVIAAVVAAAAAVKAQENRKMEAKAALERQEEEKVEKDRQLFTKAHMTLTPAPNKPKSAFSFFSDALYEKRGLQQQQQQQQQQNLQLVMPTSEDDSACPAMLFDQLPQQQKEVYETMANKARKTYRKAVKEYERDLEAARSRAREVIAMLDPVQRAAKVDEMIREVAAVRKKIRNSGDDEWFQPDRQRLVRHQLDWRLRHAAKSGCTQADFARNLTKLYTVEGQKQEEKRKQEQMRLQKVEQERRMKAEAEKVKQLQQQMQRVHQLQQLQQMQAAKQAMAYQVQSYSQPYYPHQAYPWGVMVPTQVAHAHAYPQPAVPVPAQSNPQIVQPPKPPQPLLARSQSSRATSANPVGAPADPAPTRSSSSEACPLMALAELAESHANGPGADNRGRAR